MTSSSLYIPSKYLLRCSPNHKRLQTKTYFLQPWLSAYLEDVVQHSMYLKEAISRNKSRQWINLPSNKALYVQNITCLALATIYHILLTLWHPLVVFFPQSSDINFSNECAKRMNHLI